VSTTPIPIKTQGLADLMRALGSAARAATKVLSFAPNEMKNFALTHAAHTLRASKARILTANDHDLRHAEAKKLGDAAIERLRLDSDRIEAIAAGLEAVAALPDPIGVTLKKWKRPNGLRIRRVSVPLGVIGMIYESRPNVTADAGALCLKSGNPVILRSGSESQKSSAAIHACLEEGLMESGLPTAAIQLVPTSDRAAVGHMLADMAEFIDVIVPRGGRELIERVQREARVPVMGHLEGICHVYVDGTADLEMAKQIVLNSKMRRTGICGAAETLLVDAGAVQTHLAPLLDALLRAGCEVRGDSSCLLADSRVNPATEQDWRTEYLDAIISVRIVGNVDAAMAHIARFGSQHTDCIVSEDPAAVERFLTRVDSAIVLHNASTQFADGGEFGMGAEIGISTNKLHARGPVGVEQLTSYKYVVTGKGQIRG
jgi:glutamate-5-semialdehyde dehydrogenase